MEDYYTHRNSGHRYLIRKVDDEGDIQLIDADGLADEQHTKIMRVYPYGFSSNSPEESHMLALGLGGRRDLLVALGGEHPKYRPRKLPTGNAVLYDDKGNVVWSKGKDGLSVNAKTGTVEIRSQDNKITVKPGDGQKVFLGGDGSDGSYAKVMTESGPSINVYAKIG